MTAPFVAIEVVTPETALRWLERNDEDNRAVDAARVSEYARTMQRGRWRLNGSAVVFTPDGTLVNGQHRLRACVEAGVPFRTVVLRNGEW